MTTTVTPMHAWNRHLSKLFDCGCEHCERNYAQYKAELDAMHRRNFERFVELLAEHGYTVDDMPQHNAWIWPTRTLPDEYFANNRLRDDEERAITQALIKRRAELDAIYMAEAGIASMDDVNPNHKKNRRRK